MPALIELALVWIAWCVLHSVLVAGPVRRFLERWLGKRARAYRLLYNLFALVTLVPVFLFAWSVSGPADFDWWGASLPVSVLLFLLSLALFRAGARAYDLSTFLGVRQLRNRRGGSATVTPGGEAGKPIPGGTGLHATGGISRQGILGAVRHPWYTAGILLLWVGPKSAAGLVTAGVLTLYLVVGAHVEERRLVKDFGEEYRRYRREVSMFLPFRWVRGRRTGATGPE
jgi:protein-S-isoprenylcysteine O-methyltransferase Ste14